MSFNLEDQAPVIVKLDDSGVIFENREADIVLAPRFTNISRHLHDVALEERVDDFLVALLILVLNARGEDLVLAVLAPGLGQRFEFYISRHSAKPESLARSDHIILAEVELDRQHLLKG